MKLATKYLLIAIALEIFLAIATICLLTGIRSLEEIFRNFHRFIPTLTPVLLLVFILG